MKISSFFSAISFLILMLILVLGCKKENQDIIPETVNPSISTNPTKDTVVEKGSTCSISWNTHDIASLLVKINDVNQSTQLDYSISISPIIDEVRIKFEGLDLNGDSVKKIIRIMPQSVIFNKPTIKLTSNPEGNLPPGGGIVTITWTTTDADSVLHNGEWYPPYGAIQRTVTDTTTFVFLAKGKGGQTTKEITVIVDAVVIPPTPTIEELLCLGPWKLVQVLTAYSSDGPWQELDIYTECQQDDRLIFHPNNTSTYDRGEILCPGESNRYSNSSWNLVENVINNYYEILIINSDSIVWQNPSVEIQEDGVTTVDIIVKSIFVHP